MNDDGVITICKGSGENLEHLNLTYCSDITDKSLIAIANHCPKLTSIILWGCYNITDVGLEALANGCPSINTLNLKCCKKVSNQGVFSLSKLRDLESLNLTYNRSISSYGLEVLLPHLTKLRSLTLSFCSNLDDAALVTIAKYSPQIRSLDLTQCNITDQGLALLAGGCTSITHLNLSCCELISDAGLQQLVQKCNELRSLCVEDCSRLTGGFISAFAANKLGTVAIAHNHHSYV
jgi:hypothetical protein